MNAARLWDDIVRTGSNDAISAHFVGSIVYIEKGLYQVSSQSPLLVIDGQQRLTTVTLILEALARQLVDSEPVDGFLRPRNCAGYLPAKSIGGERAWIQVAAHKDRQGEPPRLGSTEGTTHRPIPARHCELRLLRGAGEKPRRPTFPHFATASRSWSWWTSRSVETKIILSSSSRA